MISEALRVLGWSPGNWVPLKGERRLPRVDLSGSGRDKDIKCLADLWLGSIFNKTSSLPFEGFILQLLWITIGGKTFELLYFATIGLSVQETCGF